MGYYVVIVTAVTLICLI